MSCLDGKLPVNLREVYSLHYCGDSEGRLNRIEAWWRGRVRLGSWPIGPEGHADARINEAIRQAIAAIRRDAFGKGGRAHAPKG